jgi:hypothetical protein
MNERKLIDEIKLSLQQEVIAGYWNGKVFVSDDKKTYTNIISNSQPIGVGFIVPYEGRWLLVVGSSNSEGRKNIINSKRSRRKPLIEELVYPVITLLQSDFNTEYNSNTKPEGEKDFEYWLTGGGNYKLKRIVTDPTLGFEQSEALIYYDGSDAFLQNAGNGKYLAATRSHEFPPINYGGVESRSYSRNIFTIQKEDKSVVKIVSDFYGNFTYLGNGIYQSFIEDGIGDIFEQIPSLLRNNSTIDNAYINIGTATANILPKNKNYYIFNGQIFELSGSITVDLTEAFIYFTYDSQFSYLSMKDRTFAWRNKTIQHQTWLPTGNTTFNYSSTKTKFRNNLPGDENTYQYSFLYNYTFNETMSGELLVMSWKKKYITTTFEIEKESKDWITMETLPDYPFARNIITKTQEITSKNEVLTLKTYEDTEGSNNLILNSNGKWLRLPKRPMQLNSDTNLTITRETTSFRIKIDFGYLGIVPEDYEPDYDLTPYINENIITSFMIEDSAYIVRGKISTIDFELYSPNNTNVYSGRYWFTIQITQFKSVPKVVTKSLDSFDYRPFELPFPWAIILDNGCFWNYYLSHEPTNVNVEKFVTSYSYFAGGNSFSQLGRASSNTNSFICNQIHKYIHTNPITVPFCSTIYYPPSRLLKSDNLIGNSIYRINDDILLETYIENATSDWLSITKIPVSEWKITPDGNIKYHNTFLVDYQLKRPYYDEQYDESKTFSLIPVTHSYYPA